MGWAKFLSSKTFRLYVSVIQACYYVLIECCCSCIQVYLHLNHVNVCLSYSAVLRLVTEISKRNVLPLQRWLAEGAVVKFIGDNVNKTRGVRDIRSDHHSVMKHMFSVLVTKLRVTIPVVETFTPPPVLSSEPLSSFLPSSADVHAIQSNLIIIFSRIICTYIKALAPLSKSVPEHISHIYSKEMEQKSEVIVLDVLHKNETKNSDMLDIMKTMQSYLGDYSGTVLSGGDQLTCERQRCSQQHMMDSNTRSERLELLEPQVEDWHALQCFLMVNMYIS